MGGRPFFCSHVSVARGPGLAATVGHTMLCLPLGAEDQMLLLYLTCTFGGGMGVCAGCGGSR